MAEKKILAKSKTILFVTEQLLTIFLLHLIDRIEESIEYYAANAESYIKTIYIFIKKAVYLE